MLPPPPTRLLDTEYSLPLVVRVVLLALKLVSVSLPCTPYAPNPWIGYPLLLLALLDVDDGQWAPGGMWASGDLRFSSLLLVVHIAVVLGAVKGDGLCCGGMGVGEH